METKSTGTLLSAQCWMKAIGPGGLRGRRSAYAESGVDCLDRARRVVVELEVGGLLGIAAPEIDVGLVPDFEVPLRDFVDTVAFDEMLRELRDQVVPLRVVLGRSDVLACTRRHERVAVAQASAA